MGILLPLKRGTAPNIRPMSIVAKRSPITATVEHLLDKSKNCNILPSSVAVWPVSPSIPWIVVPAPAVITPRPVIPAIPTAIVVPSIAIGVVVVATTVVVRSVAGPYIPILTANSAQTTINVQIIVNAFTLGLYYHFTLCLFSCLHFINILPLLLNKNVNW